MKDIQVIPSCHDGGMVSLIQSHAYILLAIFASLNLKASVGMYSRCDYPLQILFVYFLILPSLLHSSILFNCFYTCITKWHIRHTQLSMRRTHPLLRNCRDNAKLACHCTASYKMEWIYTQTKMSD